MSEIEEKKEYLRSYEKAVRQMERSAEKIEEMRLGQIIPAADNDGMPHAHNSTDLSGYAALLDEAEKKYLKDRYHIRRSPKMVTDLLIDSETGENFTYESSIDEQTYDQIKIVYDNEKTGKREVYMAKDSGNINKWGVLQYYEKANSDVGLAQKVDALLQLYNQKTRSLKISSAIGDLRVRAGSSVGVMLDLGDISVRSLMICEKVKHTFRNDYHTMDLTLRGNSFT